MGLIDQPGAYLHLTATSPEGKNQGGAGSHAILAYANVNLASTGATLTIYDGTSTTGTKVAVIDASSATGRQFTYNVRCANGVYAVLTPAATGADCTVTVI